MANNLLPPALMAGNSVILKPSEHTPLVADLFVRALQHHLPEHLIQIAHGHHPLHCLHSSAEITSGTKYIIRTDLLFER